MCTLTSFKTTSFENKTLNLWEGRTQMQRMLRVWLFIDQFNGLTTCWKTTNVNLRLRLREGQTVKPLPRVRHHMLCITDYDWRCEGWSLGGGRHGFWWCAAAGLSMLLFWRLWLWERHVQLEQRWIGWRWLVPAKGKLQRPPWTRRGPHHTHTFGSAFTLIYIFFIHKKVDNVTYYSR